MEFRYLFYKYTHKTFFTDLQKEDSFANPNNFILYICYYTYK